MVLVYNVYIFFVDYKRPEQQSLIKKSHDEKTRTTLKKINKEPIKKTYDENDFMSFDTSEEFNVRKRWDLIIRNVIQNPEFYSCVTSLNRKTFGIK